MPKALSPTPYVPSGAGGTASAFSGLGQITGVGGCVSPSASPVTVSALSHYSSSTAGLLDELQICSLDSPGASPTPSPTLSHVSTFASTAALDDVLTTTVASTAAAATYTNVIIPARRRCHTRHFEKLEWFPSHPPPYWFKRINQTFSNVVTTEFYLLLTPTLSLPVKYKISYVSFLC